MVQKREVVHYYIKKSDYAIQYDKNELTLTISKKMQYEDEQEVILSLDDQVQLLEILKDILEGE